MSRKYPDDIFIYVNGRPISLRELGDVADGPASGVLQFIVDKGYAGDIPEGTPWYNVFEPNCIQTGSSPQEDTEHLVVLYQDFKAYEAQCSELSYHGQFTEEHREELSRRHRAYQAMTKLTNETT